MVEDASVVSRALVKQVVNRGDLAEQIALAQVRATERQTAVLERIADLMEKRERSRSYEPPPEDTPALDPHMWGVTDGLQANDSGVDVFAGTPYADQYNLGVRIGIKRREAREARRTPSGLPSGLPSMKNGMRGEV